MARPMVSVVAQLFTVTVTGFHDASGECCGQLNLECVGGTCFEGTSHAAGYPPIHPTPRRLSTMQLASKHGGGWSGWGGGG